MLYLNMYRADIRQEDIQKLHDLKLRLGERYRPLLRPTIQAAAEVLGVMPERLRIPPISREMYEARRIALDGEVFADGKNLLVIKLDQQDQRRRRTSPSEAIASDAMHRFSISSIGPISEPTSLNFAINTANEMLGTTLSPLHYTSPKFDALKAEGRESPGEPTPAEKNGVRLLKDRAVRTLALAIKSSGGLLVRDLAKQLQSEHRSKVDELITALREGTLIESEIVVVCNKSQAQVTRAPNRDVLQELSEKGVKCACGRPLSDERMEEAITITDLGRTLLEKSRWFSLLLVEELRRLGIPQDAILIEQAIGGDEIDCVANISGELALFELKDKEFNLGNAYSFGAKIGIIEPKHAVIVTTDRVGNDAKEHFVRARLSGQRREYSDSSEGTNEIRYIEGVDNLRIVIEQLVASIYRQDAAVIVDQVVPLASLAGVELVRAVEEAAEKRPMDVSIDVEPPSKGTQSAPKSSLVPITPEKVVPHS